MKHPVVRGPARSPIVRIPARQLFALSTLAACLLSGRGEAVAATCAPDADVTVSCGGLVINNPNQTITIQANTTLSNPATNGTAILINPSATGITFINNGTITSWNVTVLNQGQFTTFVNNGTITSGDFFFNRGAIGTLSNFGSMTGYGWAMFNDRPITTLNNRQGGNAPLVMYSTELPTNYNIVIDSPSVYGQLRITYATGTMKFGIYPTSVVAPGTYEDVLTGPYGSAVTNTSGTFKGLDWSLLFDGGSYDLVFVVPVPTAQDTLSSMQAAADGLRTVFALQSAYLSVTAPLSYGALSERAVSLLLGSHVAARLTPRFTLTGFAGVEHDRSRKSGNYTVTGVAGLSSLTFNSSPKKTRPVASLGGTYDISKTQQVSAQWVYRKEAFSPLATNSLLATYSVGF